jgi:hypothetical protein
MELLNQLTQNLGVTLEQARGGTGLIMRLAREKLDSGDFNRVANLIPGVENLIKAAPEPSGTEKALGALTSAPVGETEGIGNLVNLTGGFSKLGLDSGMVSRFVPIVLSFIQSRGGTDTRSVLEKVLR